MRGLDSMVLACAGAGKTTLIAGLCQGFKNAILEYQKYAISLSLIAFNKDIASELDDDIMKGLTKALSDAGIKVDWSAKTSIHGVENM